jgi:hypothetical protein
LAKEEYVGQNDSNVIERMTINNAEINSLLSDDEIDLREVLAAFRRRWIWVASGGLLGLGIAAGVSMLKPAEVQVIRMVVDITQSPCVWTQRKFQRFEESEVLNIKCQGEFLATRKDLVTLASDEFGSDESFSVKVRPLVFGNKKSQ